MATEDDVAAVHATADHAGRRLGLTVCQLMRVQEGRIVEVRGHYSDQAALDTFWGPDPARGADRARGAEGGQNDVP
jgi:ketosteroid isomerase-like protein